MSEVLTDKQQFWFSHIEAANSSGQSIAEYAKAHNLKAQQLYQWRSALKSKSVTVSTEAKFTRIVTSTPLPSARLTLDLAEARLEFDALPDPVWLSTLLSTIVVR